MKASKSKVGRPSKFDPQEALQKAMLRFWRNGYEGTSITSLTEAMGINAPSLYAAFGDKKQLFLKAVELYLRGAQAPDAALSIPEAPTAKAVVREILNGVAVLYTGEQTPPGCLVGTSALSVSEGAKDVQEALSRIRTDMEAQLLRRIQRDIEQGLLPPDTQAAALAAFTMATMQGLSTLARDGAPREKLLAVAALSLQAWPDGPCTAGG